MDRTIMDIPVSAWNWEKIKEYFQAYTHVDPDHIPEEYKEYVITMRDLLMQHARLRIIFSREKVTGKEKDAIFFREGQSFQGKMIGKAYEDAEEIILYVISIVNMDALLEKQSDMLEAFFLEYWAVSLLNASREKIYEEWEREEALSHRKLTYVWSPGQARFELENQRPLFQLLKPEEIGVILDKYDRMIPIKSVSGTIGIVPEDSKIELIACDFCEHGKTCPGYKGKKYADQQQKRYIR